MKLGQRLHFLLMLVIGLAFPVIVLGTVLLLDVDAVPLSDRLEPLGESGGVTSWRLSLSDLPKSGPHELMFESTGNIVTLACGSEQLYEYGRAYAARGDMVGKVYVHTLLPERAWDEPLLIRLEAVDSDASPVPERVELCSWEQSRYYYITNKTMGLPLAMILLAMAICVPFFLMLADAWPLMREGLLFAGVLVCLSIQLLYSGGHFLLFCSNQHAWMRMSYLMSYLFPIFILLYFREQERDARMRRMIWAALSCNLLFFVLASMLALSGRMHFCDLDPVYDVLLTVDAMVGLYLIVHQLRQRKLSLPRMLLLGMAVLWALYYAIGRIAGMVRGAPIPLLRLDPASTCAAVLFYVLCGLYAESAIAVRRQDEQREQRLEQLEETERRGMPTREIARAMSENYESVYVIDPDNRSYVRYFQSGEQGEFGMDTEGDDFFLNLETRIPVRVFPQDQETVRRLLSLDALLAGTEGGGRYGFLYRVVEADGGSAWHKVRAVRRVFDGREWILLGVRDVDESIRREREHIERQESMLQKEMNHLEAILATAMSYLEANLSRDRILDRSHRSDLAGRYPPEAEPECVTGGYDAYIRLWAENMVVRGGERLLALVSREALIDGFRNGAKRSSVQFSIRTAAGEAQPCRLVVYLYKDKASDDVMCFSVLYDLTDRQKQEQEMRRLERELQMSRIRIFTGQMQPHFLYNALGSIQELVLDDPEYASELIGDFSIHLRASIRAMSSDEPIPFAQELENIRAYAAIEKMRFGDKLRIVYEIGAEDFLISPLSIQPLVENAIRHGIYQRGRRGGTVTVRSLEREDAWIVQVEDDGVGFDVEALRADLEAGRRDSTGLKNLMFRLDRVMSAAVDIRSTVGSGTCVTVTVPKGAETK